MRTLFLSAALLVALATTAGAQTPSTVEEAEASLAHEPAVAEVTTQALRFFQLDPDSFNRLRSSSRTRALLPLFAAGYRFDDDRFLGNEQRVVMPETTVDNTNRQLHSVNVGALWDLRQLAFNPAEVQVYGLVGVQRDIMLEITRTYFLRRQLQMRMTLRPPEESLARAALGLRIQEFTAILDVLTGGWFSREVEARRPRGES